MDHQQNRRRAMEPGGGSGQSHPPPQPCPRCNSNNTKFCYYNNYSLTQPRYFCKGCRRYWTHGGTLRNVPVGGGCRKSKRPKLATTSPGTSSGAGTSGSHLQTMSMPPPLPPPHHQVISMMDNNNNIINNNTSTTSSNVVPMMMSHSFFGGGSPGLLSSLAAMQGVNQSLSFGSNLAMLQGFSLQNFGQQPHNQEGSIPSLYSTREVGSSSMPPSMHEWNLRMGPGPEPGPVGPVVTQANINDNDHNHNRNQNLQENNDNNNRGSTNEQWSNFMGTSGLDDP